MLMRNLYKCIYCLQEKSVEEFNVEHVVPQAFGTYQENLTLHDNQVCKECNSAFSKEIEVKITRNSYESVMRVSKGVKLKSDGEILSGSRINIQGIDGIYKGLELKVVVDNNSQENISFEPYPSIGIRINENPIEYQYFKPEDFPNYSATIRENTTGNKLQIIAWSLTETEIRNLLDEKGYSSEISFSNSELPTVPEYPFNTRINLHFDCIFNRLIAKTAFNYLIYNEGREIALLPKFDPIRKFIRYGTPSDSIKINHLTEKDGDLSEEINSHIVGLMWGDNSCRSLYGFVSWFNESSHKICLSDKEDNIVRNLPLSKFNNDSKQITTIKKFFVI